MCTHWIWWQTREQLLRRVNAQTKVTGSKALNNVLASYDECIAILEAEKVFTYGAIKAFGACLLGSLAGSCNRELELTT